MNRHHSNPYEFAFILCKEKKKKLSTIFFENGCWKVTVEILEREIKIFYILFLS